MKEQEKLKATVLKLYSAGTKVADIVTQTGVPRSTVYYWIKNEIPKETSPLNLRDYRKDYRSEKDMLRSITTFMEFYNNSRPHSMNRYRTPNKHEAAYFKRKAVQKS